MIVPFIKYGRNFIYINSLITENVLQFNPSATKQNRILADICIYFCFLNLDSRFEGSKFVTENTEIRSSERVRSTNQRRCI